MSKRGCLTTAKTNEITPHPLTNERNLPESQVVSERGCHTATKTGELHH